MKFTLEIDTNRMTGTKIAGVTTVVTDPEVIDKIARKYTIAAVFVAVSANPNTRTDTLDFMLDFMRNNKCKSRYDILKRIAENPNSTKPVLDKVIEMDYPAITRFAKEHPNYKEN